MTGVTRFISFVIGLIVLVLLFVLIANRFNANRRADAQANRVTPTVTMAPAVSVSPTPAKRGFDFFGLFRRNTPTPTPTLTFAQQMEGTTGTQPTGQVAGTNNATQPNQIPNTGFPVLAWPLLAGAFGAGMWLRKKN